MSPELIGYTRQRLLEAADILDRAHDILLHRGWWGMRQNNPVNSLCVEAAIIQAATGETVACSQTFSLLDDGVVTHGPEWLATLCAERGLDHHWNDSWQRTEDEIFDRLRGVAKELRDEASAATA